MKKSKKKIHGNYEIALLHIAHHVYKGKYKIAILWYLGQGPKGFNELYNFFVYTSTSIFNRQLQELGEDGLIKRKVYEETPIRVEYSLTEIGEKLIKLFYSIIEWSEKYIETQKEEKVSKIEDEYKSYKGLIDWDKRLQK